MPLLLHRAAIAEAHPRTRLRGVAGRGRLLAFRGLLWTTDSAGRFDGSPVSVGLRMLHGMVSIHGHSGRNPIRLEGVERVHGPMQMRAILGCAGLIIVAISAAGCESKPVVHTASYKFVPMHREARQHLLDALMPVQLTNCEMERFGSEQDGGYPLCGNLMQNVEVAYSYGINGRDSWGCAVSERYGIEVHQYDCFETAAPLCPRGSSLFHAECIGAEKRVLDGRPFDTLSSQIVRNRNQNMELVMKMDVEGAEWDSLLATPNSVFARVDQLVVEFHDLDDQRYLKLVEKLRKQFYVANLHFNNNSCAEDLAPFPAWAFEVLFVSKRIAKTKGVAAPLPHPLDAPNQPLLPDCQLPVEG